MNECNFYQELISRMLDEDLSGEESVLLAEHLNGCEECSNLYRAFSMVSECINEGMEEAPEEIRINVMAEIRRAEIAKQSKAKNKKRVKRFVAAAACLVLVLSVSLLTQPSMNKNTSAVYTKATFDAKPAEAPAKAAAPAAAEPMQEKRLATESVAGGVITEEAKVESAAQEEVENSVSAYSMFAADEAEVHSEPAEAQPASGTWEELSAILAGTASSRNPEELSGGESYNLSYIHEEQTQNISIISCENALYYTDPYDGIFKESACSFEAIADFLT